ncbi:response regulator [Spirosoma sp. KNUC1025]|uniref:hybrid sensor histidine kinase/response regulator n=1 Tax=Spirosoma sp. KNUC1025 TaxID=2894082 RepID=UPI003870307E|nr:response regulator [Spirosoma sp. KNUC1025]
MSTQILLIEDEVQIRENVQELLTLCGYQVDTASNGREGIGQALLQRPDLILCDIMMPEANGYQVLDAVRNNRLLASVPFIFLTAKTEPGDIRQGMIKGADDYLTKPFTFENLLQTITSRLQREALRKADINSQIEEYRHRFTSLSAHEYNTCLNGIIGFSTLLVDQYQALDKDEILSFIEMIKVSGERLKRSLNNVQLMDELQHLQSTNSLYSYFSEGSSFVTAELVEELTQAVEYRQSQKIDYCSQVNTAQVRMSEENVRICIEELIDNAFKFSSVNQTVHMRGAIDQEDYCFSITNTGQPFTPENIAQIAPYKQFDRKQYEQQGFGLGLSIVKSLVQLNEGKLIIESPSAGPTTVTIRLPMLQAS